MTGAIVVRWGAGIPGRESKGLDPFGSDVFRHATRHRQHAAGRFESWLLEWATASSDAVVADATYLDGGTFTVA